jgi:hypothetical protein
VTWASATTATATINTAGLATAVAAGTSTISATLSGVTGSTTLTVTAPVATLQSIAVTPANPSILRGATQQFTATGTFSDNSTQNLTSQVTWASATTATATINTAGLATAVAAGTSTISATLSGVTGSTTLTVTAPVATLQSIAVTPANPSVAAGATQQFTATGTFSDSSTQNLTSQVTWTSGTPAAATINSAGLATGVAAGTATITAALTGITGSTVLTVTAPVVTLRSIAVTPASASITAGATQQFTATGTFSDNSTQNVTSQVIWSSSTTAVATVSAAGLATGVAAGTATITAALSGVTGSAVLTVTNPVATLQSIAVAPAGPSILRGTTQQFTATGTFSDNSTQNLTGQVTWSSGTPAAATINSAGLATGVAVGSSTISAALGGVTGSTVLTVTAPVVVLQTITVAPASASIAKGKTQSFTATGTFSDNSTQNLTTQVTWASGSPAVATISASGVATGVGTGSASITATLNGVTGQAVLTVTPSALVSIAVSPSGAVIPKGKGQQFTATGTFADGTTQDVSGQVTWSSGTPSVATISSSGAAVALAPGTTTIGATLSGISAQVVLTVSPPSLQSITVAPASAAVPKGGTEQFTATGVYSDNTFANLTNQVTWTSTVPAVATINGAGVASAVTIGTAAIAASFGGVIGQAFLTVNPAVVQSIAVAPASPRIARGTAEPFTAVGTFSDNSTQDLTSQVTWASATTSVATISAAGVASGLAAGTSTITAALGGVSGQAVLTVTTATLQSLAVAPANPSVPKGSTQKFTATATFSDGTAQDLTNQVTWSSAATSVASISASGVATALAPGSSSINAGFGGLTAATVLTVSPAALVSLAVAPASPSIPKGSTVSFTATGTFTDGSTQDVTNQVTWTSASVAVATISAAGVAVGLAPGTSTITANAASITARTVLTVTPAVLRSIAVAPASPSAPKGTIIAFTATGTFSDSTTQDLTTQVTWTSAKTFVAAISAAGVASALAPGTSTISATLDGLTGTAVMTVTAAALQSITVAPAIASIPKGKTVALTATGTFTDGTTQDLTGQVAWASGSSSVAGISAAGVATGLAPGTATIRATLGGVTGQSVLTVTPAVLQILVVAPGGLSLPKGMTEAFTATGTFSDNSTQDLTSQVTWASTNSVVATISTSGVATGQQPGTSTIIAALSGVTGQTVLTVTSAILLSIAVAPVGPSIARGTTVPLTATGLLSDGTTEDLTTQVAWVSAKASVATISPAGLASGVAPGTASISAQFAGQSGQTVLTVKDVSLVSIAVTAASSSLPKGKTEPFSATGTFSDGSTQDLTSQVTWASAAPSVASISAAGVTTALATGTVSLSAAFGSVTGQTLLTVSPAVLTSIAIVPAGPSVPVGKTESFTATGTFSDGTSQNVTSQVTWSSAATSVATISPAGVATGLATGTTPISARLGSLSAATVLTVSPAVLLSITVAPASSSIPKGSTVAFVATGTFSDNATQNLTSQVAWTSANAAVASINSAGVASGLSGERVTQRHAIGYHGPGGPDGHPRRPAIHRRAARQPGRPQGHNRRLQRRWDLLRRHDPGPDNPGGLDLGQYHGGHDQFVRCGLYKCVARSHSHHGDAG